MKCHVQNIHTMDELKMTGNCLKGSRGLVTFDGNWEGAEWKTLCKELLTHVSILHRSLVLDVYRIASYPRGKFTDGADILGSKNVKTSKTVH